MKRRTMLLAAAALTTFGLGVMVEPDPVQWSEESGIVASAEARVGRPWTPASVAGVARRTTRRAIRRTTIYVATLPPSCATVVINSSSYYQCGATYYEPYGGQYVVVYVD